MRRDDSLTRALIGAAMEVHNYWGPGYLEAVYQKSLVNELGRRGFKVQAEVPFALHYKGDDIGAFYRADLVCENVLLELKSHSGLCDADLAQTIHYLCCTGLERALLINFGLPRLQYRRVVNGWIDDETSDDAV